MIPRQSLMKTFRIQVRLRAVVALMLAGASLAIGGCSQRSKHPAIPKGWLKVDAGPFSIYAPPGWTFHKLRGIDSYVGEFAGGGLTLDFDYGQHSNSLDGEKEPTYVVAHEMVGGFQAKIVSPHTPGHGVTGIYFPDVSGPTKLDSNELVLDGADLAATQQELALRIFRTIQFR